MSFSSVLCESQMTVSYQQRGEHDVALVLMQRTI